MAGACEQPGVEDRLNRDSLRHKSIEQLPAVSRCSTVEAKRELIKIGVQLLKGQSTLMRTQQPAFEQGGHSAHTGQQGRRCLAAAVDHAWSVLVALLLQPCIGLPSVRNDHGARLNRVLHEGDERARGGGWNST